MESLSIFLPDCTNFILPTNSQGNVHPLSSFLESSNESISGKDNSPLFSPTFFSNHTAFPLQFLNVQSRDESGSFIDHTASTSIPILTTSPSNVEEKKSPILLEKLKKEKALKKRKENNRLHAQQSRIRTKNKIQELEKIAEDNEKNKEIIKTLTKKLEPLLPSELLSSESHSTTSENAPESFEDYTNRISIIVNKLLLDRTELKTIIEQQNFEMKQSESLHLSQLHKEKEKVIQQQQLINQQHKEIKELKEKAIVNSGKPL